MNDKVIDTGVKTKPTTAAANVRAKTMTAAINLEAVVASNDKNVEEKVTTPIAIAAGDTTMDVKTTTVTIDATT